MGGGIFFLGYNHRPFPQSLAGTKYVCLFPLDDLFQWCFSLTRRHTHSHTLSLTPPHGAHSQNAWRLDPEERATPFDYWIPPIHKFSSLRSAALTHTHTHTHTTAVTLFATPRDSRTGSRVGEGGARGSPNKSGLMGNLVVCDCEKWQIFYIAQLTDNRTQLSSHPQTAMISSEFQRENKISSSAQEDWKNRHRRTETETSPFFEQQNQ